MPCNCGRLVGAHDHLGDAFAQGATSCGVSLNSSVDLHALQVWNARGQGAALARRVFDPACADNNDPLCSDDGPELLVCVPLTSVCKVRGVCIVGPDSAYAPMHVKLYCDPAEMHGFSSVQRLRAQEELQLAQVAYDDRVVYRLNATKFARVSTLVFFFDRSFNDSEVHLLRVELFGEPSMVSTAPRVATNLVFEARANPADHRTADDNKPEAFIVQ